MGHELRLRLAARLRVLASSAADVHSNFRTICKPSAYVIKHILLQRLAAGPTVQGKLCVAGCLHQLQHLGPHSGHQLEPSWKMWRKLCQETSNGVTMIGTMVLRFAQGIHHDDGHFGGYLSRPVKVSQWFQYSQLHYSLRIRDALSHTENVLKMRLREQVIPVGG